jgi:hypothetical protein
MISTCANISAVAACVIRCRESKSEAYREFEDPVFKHRADGPPTHYEFVCKQYVRVSY